MSGYGVLYYPDGTVAYRGEWSNDQFNGQGVIFNSNINHIGGHFDYSNFNMLEED